MKNLFYSRYEKGFTLLEVVLAMGITTILIVGMGMLFSLSIKNWDRNNERSELAQHVRIGMDRMMHSLRYATLLIQADSVTHSNLEFDTTNYVDSDSGTERVYYMRANGNESIRVREDSGFWLYLSGIPFEYPRVTSMIVTPMKLDASNNLVTLGFGDPLSVAIAVRVELTMEDVDQNTLTVTSLSKMRNL